MDRKHHYVPQWFQKRFMHAGSQKYYYLDLHPQPRKDTKGVPLRDRSGNYIYVPNPLMRAPVSCFFGWNLYRRFSQQGFSDELEEIFYGKIDVVSARLWPSLRNCISDPKTLSIILDFMCSMSMRTPKGLDYLATLVLRAIPGIPYATRQHALEGVKPHKNFMVSNWCDTLWEIVSAEKSMVKFIISDDPVTYYHPHFDPLAWVCRYPEDPSPLLVGTRTVFPIDMSTCLVLTNKEALLSRGKHTNHKNTILLPEQAGILKINDVIIGRHLSEQEVLSINYILKRRAKRYVAVADERWLYPEKNLETRVWRKCLSALLPTNSEKLDKILRDYKSWLDVAPQRTFRTIPARISKRRIKPGKWRGLPP